MKSLFKNVKNIKTKFLVQYGILIVLTTILVVEMFFSLQKISNYSDTKSIAQETYIELLQMRKAEKNFILEDITNSDYFENNKSQNIDSYNELKKNVNTKISILRKSEVVEKMNFSDSLSKTLNFVKNYENNFNLLTLKIKQKGFKNWGYEGNLREAIHAIEKGNLPFDKVQMLTLRRYEKDFLLRKDIEYVEKFDDAFQEFKQSVVVSKNLELLPALYDYKKEFHNVVKSEIEIGLTINSGIKKGLSNSLNQAENSLARINTEIKRYVDSTISNTYILLTILFGIQLLLAIYLANTFANSTSKSINTIKEAITTLSNGEFPDKIKNESLDEIGHASDSFNNLVDRISVASDFAQKIGNGELDIHYDTNFNDDVLAKSLQSMHFQLKKVSEENEKRNWINEGLAKFVELSRDTSDIKRFYNIILSNIVRYIGANQGYLYVLNDEESEIEKQFMEIKAVYAYGKEKYLSDKKQIKYQEGLIGQAWFDMDSLFYTEIPQDYVTITSGMGEATPSCMFICPLIVNEVIVGMIEIASFEVLESHKIEFINKITESIASTISSVKTNEKTKTLLEQSQLLTADLREQEEEIRQNMEEMNATNEEMERKERSMIDKIKELEFELETYKKASKIKEN
jgi:HAMP domain-containing protein